MTNKSPSNDVKNLIHTWLMEDGWSLRKQQFPHASWAFIAEDQSDRKIIVGQKVGREDQLLIQASITPTGDVPGQIDRLSEEERNDFIWDLRFELLRAELDFSGVVVPLERVEVMRRICSDALTKDAFIQRLGQVHRGVIIVQWMIARKFAKPLPQKEVGFRSQT